MANESYHTRQLRKELATVGKFNKIAAGMNPAGVSDLIGCVRGRYVALEAKVHPNVCTPLQEAFLTDTVVNGGLAAVVVYYPKEKGWICIDWDTGAKTTHITKQEAAAWVLKQSSLNTSLTLSNT